jgi:hypothetical protein
MVKKGVIAISRMQIYQWFTESGFSVAQGESSIPTLVPIRGSVGHQYKILAQRVKSQLQKDFE